MRICAAPAQTFFASEQVSQSDFRRMRIWLLLTRGTIRARVGYVLLGDTVEPALSGHPGNCQVTAKLQVDRLRQVAQNTSQTQNHLVNNYLMNKLQR